MSARRVLHLIDTGGPGGAETVFLELVTRLPARGWESVAVVPVRDWLAAALEERGVQPGILGSSGSFDLGYARSLRRMIRSAEIDVVQTHLLGTAVYGSLACTASPTPLIATFHGHPDIPRTGRFIGTKVRLLSRSRNQLVCVSQPLADHFRASGTFAADVSTRVIPNGIDVEAFATAPAADLHEELGLRPETRIVGAIGNVRPSKAYDVLLRAFAHARSDCSNLHLVIAGQPGGELSAELDALRSELGLGDACTFLGFRPDVGSILAALDVFVLSSSDEGFSLATVQAMASGTPIVSTRCGGPEQIVGDSGSALFVSTGDPSALSAAILSVLRDPAAAAERVTAGERRVLGHYSVDRMVSDYAELYEQMLDGGRD